MTIVGVDCATKDAKIGLALGAIREGRLEVIDVVLCSRDRQAASTIAGWISESDKPTLLAVDAPFGWPAPLGATLRQHQAGDAIRTPADAMFRRTTDAFIRDQHRKTPLDVGADRIARTALAALRLLGDLRSLLDTEIPLAWDPDTVGTVAAIEVYPAATLKAYGLRSNGYKKEDQDRERLEILQGLAALLSLRPDSADVCRSADLVDAVVCVMAGFDFFQNASPCPANRPLAEREGWIWCRSAALAEA